MPCRIEARITITFRIDMKPTNDLSEGQLMLYIYAETDDGAVTQILSTRCLFRQLLSAGRKNIACHVFGAAAGRGV